jgi:DNA polymerase III subunit delta
MTAYKAQQVARLIESPPSSIHGYLFYGTDPGQVGERTGTLAKRLSETSNPAGEIIKLHDSDLAQSPGCLLVEAQILPMFGGKKVVWVKAGQHLSLDQLGELFSGGAPASHVIIEAGNLKKDAKIRVFFEKHSALAAIPCYGDEAGDMAKLIQKELSDTGIEIAPEALRRLQDSVGGDLTLARAELEKLRLYIGDETKLTLEHVEALAGDAVVMATDDVIGAAFAGDVEGVFRQADRLFAGSTAAQGLLIGLGSYLFRLHQIRAAMDSGEGIEIAVKRLRPPLFYKQEEIFKGLCRAWTAGRLAAGLAMVQETIRQTRLQPGLEIEMTMRALMSIALEARKMKAGARAR